VSRLQKEQLEEWFDSPVTSYFLSLLQSRLDHTFQLRAAVFFPGEPQKTQEGKATLLGMESELGDLIEAFEEKDLSVLEVEEQADERVRNTSERRSSSH
jgi:hypothetical protein